MERILLQRSLLSYFKGQTFDFKNYHVEMHDLYFEIEEINGFVVYQQSFSINDKVGRYANSSIFLIRPNKSSRWFAFRHYSAATDFCKSYINAHSDNFWLKMWSPFFAVANVVSIAADLVPKVAFNYPIPDDDLPF